MIEHSFQFLDRIGPKKEKTFHNQSIKTWNDFLNTSKILGIPAAKKAYFNRIIHAAKKALQEEDIIFFKEKLPSTQFWRLYPHFQDKSAFLDIETDSQGAITVIGISTYYQTKQFVKGINLDHKTVQNELDQYKMLITFNGGAFDLPKLKKQSLIINPLHLDLKPLCLHLNLRGGLKQIEHTLNLKRPAHLYGNPVDLWKALHASGDREYLDLLLSYNREDIENLKLLVEYCYNQLKEYQVKELHQP